MELTWAYLLIVFGLALLAGELFLPTGGLLFLGAGIAVAAGVVMIFYYGDAATGLLTLVAVFVLAPVIMAGAINLWPRTALGKRLVQPGPEEDATVATLPVNLELEQLRGRYGKALSDLRPSGVADFDGKRVDVMSEGLLVPAGSWLKCIDVKAGRVLVRKVDAPDLQNLDLSDLTT
jgi:membrane-bound ClpP family serine protease